ncbi:MAG: hypothetical protein RR565_02740 [Erysipelothrix sp.]
MRISQENYLNMTKNRKVTWKNTAAYITGLDVEYVQSLKISKTYLKWDESKSTLVFYGTPRMKSHYNFFDDSNLVLNSNVRQFIDYYSERVKIFIQEDNSNQTIGLIEIFDSNISERTIEKKFYFNELALLSQYNVSNNRKIIHLSPFLFESILYEDERVKNYIINLLSLAVLSKKIDVSDCEIVFEVVGNDPNLNNVLIKVPWLKLDYFGDEVGLFDSIKWIFDSDTSETSFQIKKTVVQMSLYNSLSKNNSLNQLIVNSKNFLERCNISFDIIIANRSKEYFTMLESYKSDSVKIADKSMEINSNIIINLVKLVTMVFSGFFIKIITDKSTFDAILENAEYMRFFLWFSFIMTLLIGISFFIQFSQYNKLVEEINLLNRKTYGENMYQIKKNNFCIVKMLLSLFSLILIFTLLYI